MADSLLLIARFEGGEEAPQGEAVDVAAMVREVVAQQRDTAEARYIHVDVDAPTTLTMLGRDNELKRMTQNLLANAVKSSPDGGRVEVTLKRQDDDTSRQGLQLEFLDRGAGIPERARDQAVSEVLERQGRRRDRAGTLSGEEDCRSARRQHPLRATLQGRESFRGVVAARRRACHGLMLA